MNLRKYAVFVGLPLVIYIAVVVFDVPHFFVRDKAYKLTETGNLEAVEKIASKSAEPVRQTVAEKLVDVLGEKNEQLEIDEDTFEQWSVLENFASGYRLVYPAGFNINHSFGKVDITPPSGKGTVIVYIRDDSYEVKVFNEGLGDEDMQLINAAGRLVEQTFEFISTQGYNEEEAEERRDL